MNARVLRRRSIIYEKKVFDVELNGHAPTCQCNQRRLSRSYYMLTAAAELAETPCKLVRLTREGRTRPGVQRMDVCLAGSRKANGEWRFTLRLANHLWERQHLRR
jgi:hypothetical protein